MERVRQAALVKGKTLPTTKRDKTLAKTLRAKTSNLDYGF